MSEFDQYHWALWLNLYIYMCVCKCVCVWLHGRVYVLMRYSMSDGLWIKIHRHHNSLHWPRTMKHEIALSEIISHIISLNTHVNSGWWNERGRRPFAGQQSVIMSVSSHLLTSAFQKTGSRAAPRVENISGQQWAEQRGLIYTYLISLIVWWFTAGFVPHHLSCSSD